MRRTRVAIRRERIFRNSKWQTRGARLLDLPQVLHVNLAMVVGTAALVLVGAFPIRLGGRAGG